MLYIMRHGKTDWNARHLLQGHTDIPLNEEGRKMAEDAREKYRDLHFDLCYCSPLSRARETAELFLKGSDTPITVDNRLEEINFGSYEGIEHAMDDPKYPVYTLFHHPEQYVADNGAESLDELFARSGSFLDEVIKPVLASGKDVLIVAHGGVNCSIIARYEQTPLAHFWDNLQANCALQRLE